MYSMFCNSHLGKKSVLLLLHIILQLVLGYIILNRYKLVCQLIIY